MYASHMYTCIRVQDRRANIHASYMHVSGSCINARVMHHIYVHHGHVYQDQEYMHQTYIHHWMIKERVYMYHGYMHHVYIHQGQRLSMHDKYMHRTHVSGSMIIDVCIIHTCLRVKGPRYTHIMQLCIRLKNQESYIHASKDHASYICAYQ